MTPTREIYWNIVGGALIYAFAAVAVGLVGYGIWRRVQLWRLGGEAARFDRLGQRIAGLFAEVFGHRRLLRDPFAGVAHLFIFYAFLALTIATGLIALQEWTGIHFLQGTFYLWYSLVSDAFGILGIVGILMALWRRAVVRPAHIHSTLDDWFALLLLMLIFVQGFLVEGIRIALTELPNQPELARWSPGGHAVALLLSNADADGLRSLHRSLWWFHAVTAFVFIGYLVFGKLAHIFYGLLNVLTRNLEPSGRLTHPDIEEALENDPDSLEALGVERIEQYPWKGLLDLDACTNCGRCEDVCPAHMSGVALSPRKLIRDMKEHLGEVGPTLVRASATADAATSEEAARGPLFGEIEPEGLRPAVTEEELWGCRTCGACQQECPVYIEHVPKIVDMRRHLVMTEAKMSDEVQQFLKNMDDRMHPWVGAAHDREAWFADLDVRPSTSSGSAAPAR
jgi:heterodisulfide reductase subunit C/nitrate reductase gamma subunit